MPWQRRKPVYCKNLSDTRLTELSPRLQSQQTKFRQSAQPEQEFVPAFAGLDGKVLRFDAFTTEQVGPIIGCMLPALLLLLFTPDSPSR
jgi:hypothetical protein